MFISKNELDDIYASLQAKDTYLAELSRKIRSLEQDSEKHSICLGRLYNMDVRLTVVEKDLGAITEYLQVKYVHVPSKYIAESIK